MSATEAMQRKFGCVAEERDDLNHQLEVARKDYGELQKARSQEELEELI